MSIKVLSVEVLFQQIRVTTVGNQTFPHIVRTMRRTNRVLMNGRLTKYLHKTTSTAVHYKPPRVSEPVCR